MNFEEAIAICKELPGDMAEFGVFQGEQTKRIARLSGKRVWAWDTFEGMPDDNYIEPLDNSDPPGKWKPAGDVILDFKNSGYDIPCVKGKFSETLPAFDNPDVQFSFVHVDCDHYWAYHRVLAFIAPRMVPGGIVKLDDYGSCAGAKKATDEWLADNPHKFNEDFIYF